MRKRLLFLLLFFLAFYVDAQVGIGVATPEESSILDLTSTDKGVLAPRLTTTQRRAISNPEKGLIVFNTTRDCLEVNEGTPAQPNWKSLCYPKAFRIFSDEDRTIDGTFSTYIARFQGNSPTENSLGVQVTSSGNGFVVPENGIYRIDYWLRSHSSVGGNGGLNLIVEINENQQPARRLIGKGSAEQNTTMRRGYEFTDFFELNDGDVLRFRYSRDGSATHEMTQRVFILTKI